MEGSPGLDAGNWGCPFPSLGSQIPGASRAMAEHMVTSAEVFAGCPPPVRGAERRFVGPSPRAGLGPCICSSSQLRGPICYVIPLPPCCYHVLAPNYHGSSAGHPVALPAFVYSRLQVHLEESSQCVTMMTYMHVLVRTQTFSLPIVCGLRPGTQGHPPVAASLLNMWQHFQTFLHLLFLTQTFFFHLERIKTFQKHII